MARVNPYHTILPETPPERDVYHNDDACSAGTKIKASTGSRGRTTAPSARTANSRWLDGPPVANWHRGRFCTVKARARRLSLRLLIPLRTRKRLRIRAKNPASDFGPLGTPHSKADPYLKLSPVARSSGQESNRPAARLDTGRTFRISGFVRAPRG